MKQIHYPTIVILLSARRTKFFARYYKLPQRSFDSLSYVGFKRFRTNVTAVVVRRRKKLGWFPAASRGDPKPCVSLRRAGRMIDALRPDKACEHAIVFVRFSDLQLTTTWGKSMTHTNTQLNNNAGDTAVTITSEGAAAGRSPCHG